MKNIYMNKHTYEFLLGRCSTIIKIFAFLFRTVKDHFRQDQCFRKLTVETRNDCEKI